MNLTHDRIPLKKNLFQENQPYIIFFTIYNSNSYL
jgi:hypothetical protein